MKECAGTRLAPAYQVDVNITEVQHQTFYSAASLKNYAHKTAWHTNYLEESHNNQSYF